MEQKDLEQIKAHGLSLADIERQLEYFRNGFETMKLKGAATPAEGIKVLSEDEVKEALAADLSSLKLAKFVPASGAASRMFKDLFSGADTLSSGGELAEGAPAAKFCSRIKDFPFFSEEFYGDKSQLDILNNTLLAQGLDYGSKPKGQLLFHRYDGFCRTPFEEHLVEGALYAKSADNTVNIIFTVSPEHLEGFKALFDSVKDKYESLFGVKYNIAFTLQSPATDTVAVNPDNSLFRKDDGSLLFRPAGHGALLTNLNQIDADLVVIKNIDNVCHERLIEETIKWKKVLEGRAALLHHQICGYLDAIDKGEVSDELLWEMIGFLDAQFCVKLPEEAFDGPKAAALEIVKNKLHRPLRVCGMVKNTGESGGGPFIAYDKDGATSLQNLEGAQLDKKDPAVAQMIIDGTHFNPVDLVCVLTDHKGEHFNLMEHVDSGAGFISSKSYQGRDLKAQELPGLWNGAMSDWNTQFVDVPLITFNPVKTVLDLLRPEHQA